MKLKVKRTAEFIGPVFIGVVLTVAVMLALLALTPTETQAGGPGPDSGIVVVVFPGEETSVRPISFTTEISRVGALRLAGWDVENSGDTVCSIDGVGCPSSNCFCADNWWASAGWSSGWDTMTWPIPPVENGDVIGFRWSNLSWGPPALPAPSYVAGLSALQWLQSRQSADDGGYGDIGSTVETALPIAANRREIDEWRRENDASSLMHYLYANGSSFVTNGGRAGKLAVSLAAGNGCWPVDATPLADYFDSGSGEYAPQAVDHAWGMLGTKAMSQTIPVSATDALKGMMAANGGWGWPGFGEDTDTTAIAIEAMVAAGEPVTSSHIISGLTYLKSRQNSDGGFNPGWNSTTSNASTSAAIRAILVVGQSPITGQWVISNTNPVNYLTSVQQPDGSYLYGSASSELETRQVALALLGRWLPPGINQVDTCYGLSGQVISGTVSASGLEITGSTPVTDVTISVAGWNDADISVKNDATGAYTVSVPATGVYSITLSKIGAIFSPTNLSVSVSGNPGDVTLVEDVESAPGNLSYLPIILQD